MSKTARLADLPPAPISTVPSHFARTSLPRSLWRLLRLGTHVFSGLLHVTLRFPWQPRAARAQLIQRWSRQLLAILGITLHAPAQSQHGLLIVANHISWLDIFVLNAIQPCCFVAKSEVGRWPVLGRLISSAGTIYIERERRQDTSRVNHLIAATLQHGDNVAFFPEATTSDGQSLLPFHSSLLQPAIELATPLQPVVLRYTDGTRQRHAAADYVGDTSFMQSVWQLARARDVHARASYLPLQTPQQLNRKQLAQQLHASMQAELGQTA